jgi:hypothetical protein
MGNRVMYGNYLEGRDIVDDTGSKVDFNYETSLFSRVGILDSIEYDEQDTTSFTYNLTGTPLTKQSSSLIIETSGKPVDYYSSEVTLNITMVFESLGLFSGSGNPISYTNFTPVDTSQGDRFIVNFNYTPNQDYQSAYQAYNTNEFKDKTGENGYEQLPSDWEIDSTLTGRFNFLSSKPFSYATNLYPDFTTLRSARDSSSLSDFIKFEVLPNGDIHLVPNALQFEHPDASNPDTTDYYVFYKIKRVSVSWSREIGQRSLHSNRDYQIGILYEDSEGRYSPVFESNINSVFIPASKSDDINSIKVTIPSSMKAPSWASRYKFLAKQNKTDYETIFSTKSYIDDDTGRYWVLLDGEQSNKVSVGQELIVKKDGAGPTVSEVITTVLDVKSLPTGDLYDQIAGNFSPSGVYASMSPDGWNIEQGNLTTFTSGQYVSGQDSNSIFSGYLPTGYPADIAYPVHDSNGDSWRIQSGDVVNISFSFVRRGDGNACGDEICFFNERYISSGEYADLRDFWIQQPVDLSLVDCSETNDISGANQTTFDQNEIVLPLIPITNSNIDGVNQITFGRTSNNRLYLVLISGSKNCGRRSIIKCKIEIVRNSGLLVFETNPTITNNDIYFENEQSFPIVNGYHLSGDLFDDQDQSAVQDGIVNLSFFNCFTFLNGVESYKFKDSLTGKKFYLGQRVTSVSDEDYKEIRREASITYSGVYNEQSNINRTNEFNLGLANYKDCEISYGPIQVLHGRSTDLLTLQEDRISYVSLGKNLLVAADGGGVLTSVPEVLGTQVARIEEYGISNNPESFTHYGSDIYFTDAKRSAVIQLKGGSKSESLSVISNVGMRSWFRDLFQTSFSYQKLGGYDPYMDEYVLSPNTNELPSEPILYDCGGLSITFNGILTAQEIEVNAGSLYGNVTVFVQATNEVSVTVTYNGVTTTPVTGTGSLNVYFDKDVPTVTTFTVTITPIDANPLSVTELFTGCPIADTINIVPVVLTSGVDQGDTITNAFGYTDATVSPAYTSPFVSSQVQFLSPSQMQYVTQNIVSQYGPTYTAQQGSGSVPIDGSTGIIVSSKTILDTFVFDDSVQSFSYLRTNNPSLYTNTEAGINQLLADSLPATTSGSAPIYSGLYTMPAGADDDYLFLIWDYRQNKQLKMCYSNTSDVSESCCECFSSPSCIPFLGTTVELTDGAACALSPTTTYYTSSLVISGVPNTQPILGTTVYSNLGCSSGNTVSAGFIKLADNTWVETDSNGEVISVGNC